MLFEAVPSHMPRPFAAAITEDIDDPRWEETCDPGRLWLGTTVHDETIIEAWIPYLDHSQKLICAPRSLPEKSFADKQLARMTGLDADWAAEGGERPNTDAYANARQVLAIIDIFSMPIEYVTASVSGGITICLKRGDLYADIECFNSGDIWAVISDHTQIPQTWQLDARRTAIEDSLHRINSAITPQHA